MGTGPIIIGDDGSPPLTVLETVGHVRIGRHFEFMQELMTANGSHTIGNSTGLKHVTIAQVGKPTATYPVNRIVEVLGSMKTLIIVEMQSGEVIVSAAPPLTGDFLLEWGRYAAEDTTIAKVIIDGDDTKFQANGKPVRIDIAV